MVWRRLSVQATRRILYSEHLQRRLPIKRTSFYLDPVMVSISRELLGRSRSDDENSLDCSSAPAAARGVLAVAKMIDP